MEHRFGPASQGDFVFGASRPGYPSRDVPQTEVTDWIGFMRQNAIERVVCLLPSSQLAYYKDDLLATYAGEFGKGNTLHAPIEDFHLSSAENLAEIMRFLAAGKSAQPRNTVVHCSGGSGRTGHVLTAWLVLSKGLTPEDALAAIKAGSPSRNPEEALDHGYSREELLG